MDIIRVFLIFIGLWLIPIGLGSLVASLLGAKYSLKVWILGSIFQIISLGITLIFAYLLSVKILGVQINLTSIILALLILPLPLFLGYLADYATKNVGDSSNENDWFPSSPFLSVLIFIILAPISEELLYRGLLEGYLLENTYFAAALLVPAALFAIIHYAPFKNYSNKTKLIVIINAFILGMIAGFFRAYYSSIIPPIIIHAEFNIYSILNHY